MAPVQNGSTPAPLNLSQSGSSGTTASPTSGWDDAHSRGTTDHTSHSSSSETGDCDIIPPYHPARTLVLCFDGTGDQFSLDNSNVVTFFSLLKKDDRHEQMVYYQPGIGTYVGEHIPTIKTKIDKLLDEMVAWNLGAHVMGGYEFLMQNYQAGDKICLFGFSRGAYTARALAGMLHKVGLLPTCNHQQVPFAYKMFARDDAQGWAQSTAFKKAFSIDVDIDFIGVWDTVSSVGIIPHTLPFTRSNSAIRVFRQALSLDERRARFKPALYVHPKPEDDKLGTQPGDMPKRDTTYATPGGLKQQNSKKPKPSRMEIERQFSQGDPDSIGTTDILEVWFAGCHCDIGGGNVKDDTPHSLARIPLRWMIRECFKTNTGIRFHAELLKRIGLNPVSLHPVVQARPPPLRADPAVHLASNAEPCTKSTEEDHEVRDALQPAYDQLVLAPFWWTLELVPMQERIQGPGPDHKESRVVTMNLGRGRLVPKHHTPFNVHRSVKIRMEAQGVKFGPYAPKATYVVEPNWVD